MSVIFEKYSAPVETKLNNFEKYVKRQSISRLLARYELFKMQLGVKGCIVECGVHHGGGLFSWAKLSSALEPYALDRRIFGFDTFCGFPSLDNKDTVTSHDQMKVGGFETGYDIFSELKELITEYDENRFLNQFEKIMLVKGDANQTIPQFIDDNPSVLISLLFMDFDLYAPTKTALECFLPRMCKGAILAFDEINNPWWPGETQALLEKLNLRDYQINRFSFDPSISYIVL